MGTPKEYFSSKNKINSNSSIRENNITPMSQYITVIEKTRQASGANLVNWQQSAE